MNVMERCRASLNRLAKWRAVLAVWQLGSRAAEDPECAAVRDHREATLLLRAEVNALTALMVARGYITLEEFQARLGEEAEELSRALERHFPGFKATDSGMQVSAPAAQDTLRVMNFKP